MKPIRTFLAGLLVLGMWPLWGQEKVPVIAFETPNRDFGRVFEGEVLKQVFKFYNKGSATLEIFKVEPS